MLKEFTAVIKNENLIKSLQITLREALEFNRQDAIAAG